MRLRRYVTMAFALFAALLVVTIAESQDKKQRRPGDRQGQGQRGSDRGRSSGGRSFGGRSFGGRSFGGSGGGRNVSLLGLLRNDAVKKEIKLDETQGELVQVVAEEVRGEQPQERFNFRESTEAERAKFLADQQARATEQAKAAKEMLATVLSEDQMKRLSEIRIQLLELAALSDPDVEKELKITPEQKEQIQKSIRESQENMQAKMRELFGGGQNADRGRGGDPRSRGSSRGGDSRSRGPSQGAGRGGDRGRGGPGGGFEQLREQMDALRAATGKKVLATLTPEQQKQFEALKGNKFDMPRPSFRGGRGGDTGRGRSSDGGRGRSSREGNGGGERKRPPTEP